MTDPTSSLLDDDDDFEESANPGASTSTDDFDDIDLPPPMVGIIRGHVCEVKPNPRNDRVLIIELKSEEPASSGQTVGIFIAAILVAAGMATAGLLPVTITFAVFTTMRACEQLRTSICYANQNVTVIGGYAGLSNSKDGATHHSIEDVAWTRAIDGLTVIVPADPIETAGAIRAAYETEGPFFIRTSRMGVPDIHAADYRFEIGKAARLREGDDVTLIANGVMEIGRAHV